MTNDELPDTRNDQLRARLLNIPQPQRIGYLADLPRAQRAEFMRILSPADRQLVNAQLSERASHKG